MALHDELAALRAEVGPEVFDDPVAFRAAFDDFIPEGSASTGEVSLLVGAIATGALQRLKEQLALGADPEISIAAQADLLARDRGTSEASGARWAMSVLAHAIGALPANGVPTRPAPGPDSLGTADRPPAPAATEVVDPARADQADTTRVAQAPPPAPAQPPAAPARHRPSPLLITAIVTLAVIAVVAFALRVLRDAGSPDGAAAADDASTKDAAAETTSSATLDASPTSVALAQLSSVGLRVAGKPFRLSLLLDGVQGDGSGSSGSRGSTVFLVLEAGLHGERGGMVDEIPASCPYFGDSYGAAIQHSGGGNFRVSWQTRNDSDYVEYGEVLPREELILLSGTDVPCPTPN